MINLFMKDDLEITYSPEGVQNIYIQNLTANYKLITYYTDAW